MGKGKTKRGIDLGQLLESEPRVLCMEGEWTGVVVRLYFRVPHEP